MKLASRVKAPPIELIMKINRLSSSGNFAPLASSAATLTAACVTMMFLASTALADAWPVQAVPGTFDTTFGTNGSGRIISMGITPNGPDYLSAMVVQPDQKIVVAGSCGTPIKFCVARLLTNGAPDTSFTGDHQDSGKFTISVGTPSQDNWGTAIAMQPDGKMVMAGNCKLSRNSVDACIVRLLPDGKLDTTFVGPWGTARGAFTIPVSNSEDAINTVLVQPDGKIVLAGLCQGVFEGTKACGARLLPNGALDSSFVGPSGTGAGTFVASLGGSNDYGISYQLQPDMKILAVSTCSGDPQDPNGTRACLSRLTTSGRFDTTFNASGTPGQIKYISGGSHRFTPAGIAVQPDGKLVLAATCEPIAAEPAKFCLVRYSSDGVADQTFVGPNRQGRGSFVLPIPGVTSASYAQSIALQSDGKIVVNGLCRGTVNDGSSDVCVARVHGDGTWDTSFDGPNAMTPGNGGFIQMMAPLNFQSLRMQIQRDGQILHGAYCRQNTGDSIDRMCIARINGGPYAAAQCSLDVDGDGASGTMTDVLLAARVAMGFTGPAVYGDIAFAESATRRYWPSIHRYLTQQCSMPLAPIDPNYDS